MALTKIINDENKSYRPVLTDKLVLDAKPTVNSFNSITSDAVARAIAGASGDVPQVTEDDNGKVLGAIYDEGGAAVEWVDPPVALPEYDASDDGKVLGVVVEGVEQTASVDWVDPPVSNVTTSDKQFVVGVNGTGLPITVDCSGATEVIVSGTITENGSSIRYQSSYPAVKFAMAHLPGNTLGSGTATLTIPEDITFDSVHIGLGSPTAGYLDGTNSMYFCTLTSGMVSSNKINAGTYTISGANSNPSVYDDGIGIFFNGGGDQPYWDDFKAALDEAVQSWTISYSGEALSGYNFAPASFPSLTGNANKVLKVNAGATGVEWATDSTVTVDQNYNSSSANAQSGTAVAQAIASIPSSSYTAGDGIVIDQNNEISVDYDTNTLDIVGQTITANVTQQSASGLFSLPSSIAALLSQQTNTQVTVHIPANMLRDANFDYSDDPDLTFRFTLYATDSTFETNVSLFSTALSWTNNGEYGLIDEQDIVLNLPASVANQWSQSLSSAAAFSICAQRSTSPLTESPVELFGNLSTDPITFSYVDASVTKLAVKNPIPAFNTTTDAGKALQVTSNGIAWINSVPIEVVASMPASPTAGVLYIVTGA